MRQMVLRKSGAYGRMALLCFICAAIGVIYFAGIGMRAIPIVAGVFAVYLLATHDLKPLRSWAAWPLLGYVVYSGISLAWAISGKFVLREYSKIFLAGVIFLFIVLQEDFSEALAQRVMTVIAAMSAIYAYLAVEAATINLIARPIHSIEALSGLGIGFNGRLSGLFGNSNFEASFWAFGVLLSIALLCHATERTDRIIYCVTLSFNAFAFLLAFSMGAIGCFVVSIVIYLIAVGKERPAAMLRMLEAAVPTVVLSFVAYALFNREGLLGFLPLLIMLLNACVTAFLELRFADKLIDVLHAHQKLAIGAVIFVLLFAAAYVGLGFTLTGPYTFGDTIQRGAYLEAGEHTLTVEADGEVSAVVTSRTYAQMLMGRNWTIRFGTVGDGMDFTVPEDSLVCFFDLSAEPGTTIYSASIDGVEALPLKYKLFPEFAAVRIQGLRYRGSAIERIPFMQDGIRIWKMSPVVGSGVGAFETALSQVQQVPYTTRYVHNHYIQVLLEGGVIGFALWVGNLVAMAVSLWLRRKTLPEEYRWLYPALWATLVMTTTQTFVDVSLSNNVFLAYNYALFALNVRVCEKAEAPVDNKAAKKRSKTSRDKSDELMIRIVCALLPIAFVLTICGNIVGKDLQDSPVADADEFFKNMASAATIDPYEWSDAEASYVMAVLDQNRPDKISQANSYAEHLSKQHSNSIPYYLVVYYLNTRQYEKGIEAAKLGATYSASIAATWDQIADALAQCFMDDLAGTPLLENSETLVPKLMEYYEMYLAYNDYALLPLEINERTYDTFSRIVALNDAIGQPEQIFSILAS